MVKVYLFRQTWYNTGYSCYHVMFLPLPDYIHREVGVKYTFTMVGSANGATHTLARAHLRFKYGPLMEMR